MASTPSPNLRMELMATGEKPNQWGTINNTDLSILERAVAGYLTLEIVSASTTLTSADYTLGTWQNLGWKLIGALTTDSAFVVPNQVKRYDILNATTGAFALTVRTSSGTGVVVPAGARALLWCDGTNVVGTVLQPYSVNSSSVGGLAGIGLVARTVSGDWSTRVLTGTADQISVFDGDGSLGNPRIALPATAVFPGTVRAALGMAVSSGGLNIESGALLVQSGVVQVTGANATVTLSSSSGFGGFEVSGPAGATIDLKVPASDDFDLRLFTSGTGGQIISRAALELIAQPGQTITSTILSGPQQILNNTGLTVTGNLSLVHASSVDSEMVTANSVRSWTLGVRASNGFWSLRNGVTDALAVDNLSRLFANGGLAVQAGGATVAGGLIVTTGAMLVSAGTFASRGISDTAVAETLSVRPLLVGIRNTNPQASLHMGTLAAPLNSAIRLEVGGPLGFRGWDTGVNYGEFNYYIADATAGVRRMTINFANGRTLFNGGVDLTGSATALNITGDTLSVGLITIGTLGAGYVLRIGNQTLGEDGAQVGYVGRLWNVSTRVSQLNGDFDFVNTGYTAVTARITQAGQIFNATGTYGTFSDARLKEHVASAPGYLSRLRALRVVDYALRSDHLDHADRIGFVADEVETVLPELVFAGGTVGDVPAAKAVATSNMIPMMVRAIQEMAGRIEYLELRQNPETYNAG